MRANYILTVFSLAMLGQRATAHVRLITAEEASGLVDDRTQIVSTRVPHTALALKQFPLAERNVIRRADMRPGSNAVLIQYIGPPIGDDGETPPGASVSFYLIEVDEYQEK